MTERLATAVRAAQSAAESPSSWSDSARDRLMSLVEALDPEETGADAEQAFYLAGLLGLLRMPEAAGSVLDMVELVAVGRPELAAALANVRGILAATYGSAEHAGPDLERALDADQTSDPALRAKMRANLATVYLLSGQLDRAASQAALIPTQPAARVEPRTVLLARIAQIADLISRGEHTDVRGLLDDVDAAVDRLAQTRAAGDPDVLDATLARAAVRFEAAAGQGRWDQAEPAVEELELLAQQLGTAHGADHPRTLSARGLLAAAELRWALADGSLPRAQRAVEILAQLAVRSAAALGEADVRTLRALVVHAGAEFDLARLLPGEAWLEQAGQRLAYAAEVSYDALGAGHPLAREAAEQLAACRSLVDAHRPRPAPRESRRTLPHVVVCGDDALAHRVVEDLARIHLQRVTVIVRSRDRGHAPAIAHIPGVRVVEAPRLDHDAFRRAWLDGAQAVALLAEDDVGNLDVALSIRELNLDLHIVIRMFNLSLGHQISVLLSSCVVLSDTATAAPAYVAATLDLKRTSFTQLHGRALRVARRSEVDPADVVCALAESDSATAPAVLPIDEDRAEVVLATAGIRPPRPLDKRFRLRLPGLSWGRAPAWSMRRSAPRRLLHATAAVLVLLFLLSIPALALADRELSFGQAAYLAALTAVGGADYDSHRSAAEQTIQTVLSLVGLAIGPALAAVVLAAILRPASRDAVRARHHIVVVGLGNLGTHIVQQLHDLGERVVAVDSDGQARGAQVARERNIPLIIGDASQGAMLREASVQTARALVLTSAADSANLEVALSAQALNGDLRVVTRLFDGDLAEQIRVAYGIAAALSSSLLAAPEFSAALLRHDVIGTIPIGRRTLLIAEVTVERDSALDGALVADLDRGGELRLIALAGGASKRIMWRPSPRRPLFAGDRLTVVASRRGLAKLHDGARSATRPDVQPASARQPSR